MDASEPAIISQRLGALSRAQLQTALDVSRYTNLVDLLAVRTDHRYH
jgi:hypothetical protein